MENSRGRDVVRYDKVKGWEIFKKLSDPSKLIENKNYKPVIATL